MGFSTGCFDFFVKPTGAINEGLSLIDVPLFRNAIGGDPAAQSRQIEIADLQVKVAEVEKQRADLADKLALYSRREKVVAKDQLSHLRCLV